MKESELHQIVVKMVLVGGKGRAPPGNPYGHDREGVQHWKTQQNQRQYRAQGRGVPLSEGKGEGDRGETEELATGIPHEN